MNRFRLAALLLPALVAPAFAQEGDGKERQVDAIYGTWSLDSDKFAEELAKSSEFQAMPEDMRKVQLDQLKTLTATFEFADGKFTVSGSMLGGEEKQEMSWKVVSQEGSDWEIEVKEADKEEPDQATIVWLADDSIKMSILGEGDSVEVVFPLSKKS